MNQFHIRHMSISPMNNILASACMLHNNKVHKYHKKENIEYNILMMGSLVRPLQLSKRSIGHVIDDQFYTSFLDNGPKYSGRASSQPRPIVLSEPFS